MGEEWLARQHKFLDHAKNREWDPIREMLAESLDLINVQPEQRYSVLHHAAKRGDAEFVGHLLACRADVLARTRDGKTVADQAQDNYNAGVKELIADAVAERVTAEGDAKNLGGELSQQRQEMVQQVSELSGA